ncbi:MAG: AMP-binding protein [Alphaproteobacteria bacterium]|nr:AMP-binding protein [Alphaproteobacteria bacterium]MDP6623602.1 AMP-binding protein [Alphaproteobacteria bacterium]
MNYSVLDRTAGSYQELYDGFQWQVPERFNIATAICDRHAEATPEAPAMIFETQDGQVTAYSFSQLRRLANQAANMFAGHGVAPGDRVAILLGQTPETAIAHLGCFKMAALSIPMFTLFGEDALEYRLQNSGARALVTDRENYPKVAAIRERCPDLEKVFLVDGQEHGAHDFWAELARASDQAETAATAADDAAFISYTSGTTGAPKGALHAHRTMIGHMTGFEMLFDFYGFDGDLMWSPADWAWLAGLMDCLFPAWWHGKPVLAFRTKGAFDPEKAFHMMAKHRVRNTLLVPTMLKLMRQVPEPPAVDLRSMFTGGEAVGSEILDWGKRCFGITVNEGYGQTECNIVMAHVPKLMPAKFGSLGKAAPGHVAAIVDDEGNVLPVGNEGHIAFRRPDPVMLLQYWQSPEATTDKYRGEWLITGDVGKCDDDGYFWFVGRADDVITSSGYRIGPGEIEDCLLQHPAVALSAAIGKPDPVRTEIIKVFIVPAEGHAPGPELETELREFVRERLAKHEYPREIEFIAELPTTATGKVMRRVLKEREIDG